MRKDKVIQLIVIPETFDHAGRVFALTEKGNIWVSYVEGRWVKWKLPLECDEESNYNE